MLFADGVIIELELKLFRRDGLDTARWWRNLDWLPTEWNLTAEIDKIWTLDSLEKLFRFNSYRPETPFHSDSDF